MLLWESPLSSGLSSFCSVANFLRASPVLMLLPNANRPPRGAPDVVYGVRLATVLVLMLA
jgi:hypothetical protein